jgi:hypothetical protein
LLDNTKKINRTVIIARRVIYAREKIKMEKELEKELKKNLEIPLPNQKSLIFGFLILVPSNILIPPVLQNNFSFF